VLLLSACTASAPASEPGTHSPTGGAAPASDAGTPNPAAGTAGSTANNATLMGGAAGMPTALGVAGAGGSGGVGGAGDAGGVGGATVVTPPTPGVVPDFPASAEPYGNGYAIFHFQANGKNVTVYAPPKPLDGLPWVWHGEFPDVIPNTNNAWLAKGLMIVYLEVPNMYGSPDAVKQWDALYATMTGTYHLAKKVVLTGISRGALYAYDWAAQNPEQVAGIYGDAPTCDFRSWPGGVALGLPQYTGPGSPSDWSALLVQYHFQSNAEAIAWPNNPVDELAPLAKAGVPLLHVYGDADTALPWTENTGVVADRYPKLGGSITLIDKPGANHDPHGLEQDPTPVVNFVLTNALRANGLAP